jgi:hypothetical protein
MERAGLDYKYYQRLDARPDGGPDAGHTAQAKSGLGHEIVDTAVRRAKPHSEKDRAFTGGASGRPDQASAAKDAGGIRRVVIS